MNAELLARAAATYCQQNQLQLAHELGRGAFKCAYLASDGQRTFALKLSEYSQASSGRLEREIAAGRACEHPAIARIESATRFDNDGYSFIAVAEEYLPGGTLEQRAASGLTESELILVVRSLADALEYLHTKRLVHRDIKPANILFRQEDQPVLTDFGLVRALDAPSLTHDFVALGPGTPLFAAPEQLNNEKALIDWRTDQYGLAMTIAHCLLGRHPYQQGDMSQMDAVMAVARRDPLPECVIRQFDARGFGFLTKALSPWPIDRFRLPDDLVKEL
jgi:serine/threonine protein kinase